MRSANSYTNWFTSIPENNTFAGIRYYGGSQSEYFYSKDVPGSTTAITNGKGECSQSYSYTDYGEISIETDSDFYNEICYTGGFMMN